MAANSDDAPPPPMRPGCDCVAADDLVRAQQVERVFVAPLLMMGIAEIVIFCDLKGIFCDQMIFLLSATMSIPLCEQRTFFPLAIVNSEIPEIQIRLWTSSMASLEVLRPGILSSSSGWTALVVLQLVTQ